METPTAIKRIRLYIDFACSHSHHSARLPHNNTEMTETTSNNNYRFYNGIVNIPFKNHLE